MSIRRAPTATATAPPDRRRPFVRAFVAASVAVLSLLLADAGSAQRAGSATGGACATPAALLAEACETHVFADPEAEASRAVGGWREPTAGRGTATVRVRTIQELVARAATLKAGDILEAEDMVVRGDHTIRVRAAGTREKPVVIRTRRPGGVVFTEGRVLVMLAGSYVHFEGFTWRGAFTPPSGQTSSSILRIGYTGARCDHCLVADVSMLDYNPPDPRHTTLWVNVRGQGIRITRSTFDGKRSLGALLNVDGDGSAYEDRLSVDRNYFGNIPDGLAATGLNNGFEAIRIRSSVEAFTSSASRVVENLFDRCSGEPEIITIKASRVVVRGNTFLSSQGAVTLRTGDDGVVEGNVFLGNGLPRTGGVRVFGRNHAIVHNHFEGLDDGDTDWADPIAVPTGSADYVGDKSYYKPAENVLVAFNNFVANRTLAEIGSGRYDTKPKSVVFVANRVALRAPTAGEPLLLKTAAGSEVALAANVAVEGESGMRAAGRVTLPVVERALLRRHAPALPAHVLARLYHLARDPGKAPSLTVLTRSDVGARTAWR